MLEGDGTSGSVNITSFRFANVPAFYESAVCIYAFAHKLCFISVRARTPAPTCVCPRGYCINIGPGEPVLCQRDGRALGAPHVPKLSLRPSPFGHLLRSGCRYFFKGWVRPESVECFPFNVQIQVGQSDV